MTASPAIDVAGIRGSAEIIKADARYLPLPDASVDLIVTSPPYWSMRAYEDDGQVYEDQIGSEPTPAAYVKTLIDCTYEMLRVLKPGGNLFVNLGDKYGRGTRTTISGTRSKQAAGHANRCVPSGSPKSLLMLPQRFAIGCVDELGMTLRAEIVWRKTNPIPDPAKDRVGRGHETILHFTKSLRYYHAVPDDQEWAVWDMQATSLKVPAHLGAKHHATFPMELPHRAIRRWCPPGGTVLDPFGGSGTTALVAKVLGRRGISVDHSSTYCRIAQWRVNDTKQLAKAAGIATPAVRVPAGSAAVLHGVR